ncbi:MAG: hypothetical protein AB8V57_02970 [Coxiella endosymbiont of Dermacentor nuttalli]
MEEKRELNSKIGNYIIIDFARALNRKVFGSRSAEERIKEMNRANVNLDIAFLTGYSTSEAFSGEGIIKL